MEKRILEQLRSHILPFNWNVKMVWALETPVRKMERATLDYLLHLPLWSSVPNKGMLFDISPMEVLEDPNRSAYQTERIEKADTSFPIDMLEWKGRSWILDGVHRLAKIHAKGIERLGARVHPASVIDKIESANQASHSIRTAARPS